MKRLRVVAEETKILPGLITAADAKRLTTLEKVVERGKRAFVEVGTALAEIKAGRLYRKEFSTFEDYCRERWGWQRQRAYELIEAAQVAKALPEECNQKITNENQAAALAKIPEPKRVEVLEQVAAAGPVTARAIREAAHVEVATVNEPVPTIARRARTFRATSNWYRSASPEKRFQFFTGHVLCAKVVVPNKAEFGKAIEQWLISCVVEQPPTEERKAA